MTPIPTSSGPYSKGVCYRCRRHYVWRRRDVLLRDARCPADGARLLGTKHNSPGPWFEWFPLLGQVRPWE